MTKQLLTGRLKRLLPAFLLAVGLLVGAGLTAFFYEYQAPASPESELYEDALWDASYPEEDEIFPLVSLVKEDARVTWDNAGERVLLLTWHNYPESYPVGENVTLEWGPVFTFTEGELKEKYAAEANSVADWTMRLKQLIGFPPDAEHSTISGFWVNPADVLRPAYQPDPTDGGMSTWFQGEVDADYVVWFRDSLTHYSYYAHPWTQLGYTYDWADNGTDYGLTEFLVNQGTEVEVAFTESTGEFLARLAGTASVDLVV